METWLIILIWLLVVALLAVGALHLFRRGPRRKKDEVPAAPGAPLSPDNGDQDQPFNPLAITKQLEEPYGSASHPSDLLGNPIFQAGVAHLASPAVPLEQVVTYCIGANEQLAALGAEALARRRDSSSATPRVATHFHFANVWTAFFMLRFLEAHADRPVIGTVLAEARPWWARNPLLPKMLSDFIDVRVAAGEQPQLAEALNAAGLQLEPESVEALVGALTTAHAPVLRATLAEWRRTRVDTTYLESVGRIWDESRLGPVVIEHGWTIFEASATDVVAGQVYIGELEKRVKELQQNLGAARRVLWYVPNFHELYHAGRHRFSPNGVLDLFLPAIEAGRVSVVGEVQPAALQKLLQERPRVRQAVKQLTLDSLTPAETLALVQHITEHDFAPARVSVAPDVLREALELARHYLGSQAQPGNVIQLLRATKARLASSEGNTI